MLILNEPLPNFLFEYPGADVTLRSHDSHYLRVPKSHLVHCSPVLDELIRKASNLPDDAPTKASLPVVQLPESGAVLHSLLTFIFPSTPLIPSTTEEAMELLSVAQKYQMAPVLSYIRYRIAQQNPPSIQRDDALHRYSLTQKYGLREEAFQAAQTIFKYPMDFADLEDKLNMMHGPPLYELWNFYQNARAILASDLAELRTSSSSVSGALGGFRCLAFESSQIPPWFNDYIKSIGDAPHLFDLVELNMALARHLRENRCACVSISSQTIRNIWEALASVVHDSFEKVSEIDIELLMSRSRG